MRTIELPALWAAPVTAWIAWIIAGAASTQSVQLRRYQIRRLAGDYRDRSPWDLTADDLALWMSVHEWSVESRRSYRAALRSFYGWGHAAGHTNSDPARLLRKVQPPRPMPRPAAEDVITQALRTATPRVQLMIMLGSREGLRRGEIAAVHTDDLSRDHHGWWLLVHGKGGKLRRVPLIDSIGRAIAAQPRGWLFPNGAGGHLTPAYVGKLVRLALGQATTHQLRHRFATRSYEATHDIRAVQELLGHASVATTQRYTAVADAAMRAAVTAVA